MNVSAVTMASGSLVRPYEILLTNGYFVLIIQSHSFQLADAILTTVYHNRLLSDERRIVTCKK